MNKNMLALLALLLLTTGLLAACTKSSDIPVNAEQNNSTLEIKVGDVLAIELEANPSTGYAWEVENLNTVILEQIGEVEFIQKKTDDEMTGAAESEVIRIKAVATGETALKLIYHRSFEKGVDPLETFYLNVVVK